MRTSTVAGVDMSTVSPPNGGVATTNKCIVRYRLCFREEKVAIFRRQTSLASAIVASNVFSTVLFFRMTNRSHNQKKRQENSTHT